MSTQEVDRPAAYGEGDNMLDAAVHDTADRIVRRYPVARSALLPLLHLVQSIQNHVTDEGIAFCAEKVGLTRAEVGAVATFYTMYKREPVGDWLLSVCTNPPCKIAGGQQIIDDYVEELGGHSDPETRVTVEHAECLGICDGAPVVQVNYEMFGPMTVAEGSELLSACRSGNPPVSPWSNERPPTFAEVEYDLSGANDAWEDQLHMAALQQVNYEVPPQYRTGETDLPVTHPGGDPAGVGGQVFRDAADGSIAKPPAPTSSTALPEDEAAATVERAPVADADAAGTPSAQVPPAERTEDVLEEQAAADAVQGSGDDPAGGEAADVGSTDADPDPTDSSAREPDSAAPAAAASDQPDAEATPGGGGPADEGLEDDAPAGQPATAEQRGEDGDPDPEPGDTRVSATADGAAPDGDGGTPPEDRTEPRGDQDEAAGDGPVATAGEQDHEVGDTGDEAVAKDEVADGDPAAHDDDEEQR